MTDKQFNQALTAYEDRTKAVAYVGNTIAALATVIAIGIGVFFLCWLWGLAT